MLRARMIQKFLEWLRRLTLVLMTLAMLFPVYWLVTTSLKPLPDALAMPPKWLFRPTLQHYREVLANADFLLGFRNSVIIGAVSLAIALLVGVPAAYSLARFKFRRKKDIAFWILSTRMFPPVAVLIPFYVMFRNLGLNDNLFTLIIMHVTLNLALVIWMMRGFFMDIPPELEEAAMIDGCGPYGAFARVMLPLALNGIIATTILAFVFSWNELMFAIVLGGSEAKTAPAMVYTCISYNEVKWGSLSAAGVLVLLPVIIFIGMVQKYLVKGLTFGAVKQ